MASYRLSKAADNDFAQIFDYGIDTHGLEAAIDYQNKLKQRFAEIAEQPLHYQAVDHIHKSSRRSVCGVHSVYYRIDPTEIVIVRILGRQDPFKAFS